MQVLSGAAAATLALPGGASAAISSDDRSPILAFLESLAREDGGCGWPGQQHSHLTATFAVIGSYQLLGRVPPRKAQLAAFVRSHHPARIRKLEQEHRAFDYQQIQSLSWLGEDPSELAPAVAAWTRPLAYLRQYEAGGLPVFSHEMAAFLCRPLLGLPVSGIGTPWIEYLESRRRPNGTYNNTPASDGTGGHVVNTWYGIQAEAVVYGKPRAGLQTVEWLRGCEMPSGGFGWSPQPDLAPVPTATCAWAATLALKALGSAPRNADGCVAFLLSLFNPDGGFGEQPGWASNPLSTFRALGALDALGRLPTIQTLERERRGFLNGTSGQGARIGPELPPGLKVFSIQIEAHGKGSPVEAVDLARSLRIHLWGAKSAGPGWIETAQRLADEAAVPTRFFAANEEYGTWLTVPGMGVYSHTSDVVFPAGAEVGSSRANRPASDWAQFRASRLEPLRRGDGRLLWQFGENEELVHLLLADSAHRGAGYSAISTYHFGNPDFTRSEPFLHLYRGQIPFVALQDAHGDEPWWFADMTEGFRTLFFGLEPTWEAWLEALERNWVVAVRRDSMSGHKIWTHAASDAHAAFALRHQADWRWWDNPHIQRPMISLVAVRPADRFEAARPAGGITLRVRCAWENTAQGRPKNPLAEMTRLVVDDRPVIPRLVAPRLPAGGFADHYHEYPLPDLGPGNHTAVAHARVLATGQAMQRRIVFSIY